MRSRILLALGGFSLAFPATAQPPAKPTTLPVTRVVLFNAGVGYFQREGSVEGNARVDLRFPEPDVNDLLKSLTLEDKDGGKPAAITYDGKHPVEVTLKSFSIDLTEGFSFGQLLGQVRGEKVEVTDKSGGTLTGLIVGVEAALPAAAGVASEGEQLNLFTAEGLQAIHLPKLKKVKFVKAELDAEFRQALEVLAAARGSAKKMVSLTFNGKGARRVKVGYVTEAPMWKASYRLTLDGKAMLQGWAAIENTTEEDWNAVKVGLVSGRPMTFQMDLYQPLFVPRPTVEPELYASLRPPVYAGNVNPTTGAGVGNFANNAQFQMQNLRANNELNVTNGTMMFQKQSSRELLGARLNYDEFNKRLAAGQVPRPGQPGPMIGGTGGAVLSSAAAITMGEIFEYKIEDTLTLPRLKSALLPIVQEAVDVGRVSIYNEANLAKHPLLGLRLVNKTKLHLSQGPVTVYEADTFAGDARIPDMKPGETRLVSYAIDLGTEVVPAHTSPTFAVGNVRIEAGRIDYTNTARFAHKYTVRNRNALERTVIVEVPSGTGRKLVSPEKASETTRNAWRFEVKVKPNDATILDVVEEMPQGTGMALLTADDDTLRTFTKAGVASPAVVAAIADILERRGAMAEARKAVAIPVDGLKAVTEDQVRIRANIERVPRDSEAYRRYLKKFDDQETQIETFQAKIKDLAGKADAAEAAYKALLAGLNVK